MTLIAVSEGLDGNLSKELVDVAGTAYRVCGRELFLRGQQVITREKVAR